MTEKMVTMTEEEYEEELNRTYKLGQSSGLKEAGAVVMKKAIEEFERETELAVRLRSIAKALRMFGEDRHPGIPAPETS